jgi:hypothetical protein
MFEVRDYATFIPVICIEIETENDMEEYLLGRMGFSDVMRYIQLVWISAGKTEYDPFRWNDRTMFNAHKYIRENWDDLETGAVIDVQYILGETPNKKVSERYYE